MKIICHALKGVANDRNILKGAATNKVIDILRVDTSQIIEIEIK
jgi:hypothetical protein